MAVVVCSSVEVSGTTNSTSYGKNNGRKGTAWLSCKCSVFPLNQRLTVRGIWWFNPAGMESPSWIFSVLLDGRRDPVRDVD